MIIEEEDFKLTPSLNNASDFWDIELQVIVKPRNGEPRKEFKIVAYGTTIESAIKRIANYRVAKNNRDKALQMKDYLSQYIIEIEKLDNLIKLKN